MRPRLLILLLLFVACEVFGYWGLNTVSGRAAFDEMAGIIPAAAQGLGWLLLIAAGVVAWRGRRR